MVRSLYEMPEQRCLFYWCCVKLPSRAALNFPMIVYETICLVMESTSLSLNIAEASRDIFSRNAQEDETEIRIKVKRWISWFRSEI